MWLYVAFKHSIEVYNVCRYISAYGEQEEKLNKRHGVSVSDLFRSYYSTPSIDSILNRVIIRLLIQLSKIFMTERNGRVVEDYQGPAWPQSEVNQTLRSRIMFAAPGRKVATRPGTNGIIVDGLKGTTWGDVMNALKQFGIIKPNDNVSGEYTKQVHGFGTFGTNLKGMMKASDRDLFGQVDIANDLLRAEFITTLLKRGNQACMHAVPGLDLTQLVPQFEAQFEAALTQALASGQNVLAQNGSIRSDLKHTFAGIIDAHSTKNPKGGLLYNGTESQLDSTKIADIWTGIIFGGLASLPR